MPHRCWSPPRHTPLSATWASETNGAQPAAVQPNQTATLVRVNPASPPSGPRPEPPDRGTPQDRVWLLCPSRRSRVTSEEELYMQKNSLQKPVSKQDFKKESYNLFTCFRVLALACMHEFFQRSDRAPAGAEDRLQNFLEANKHRPIDSHPAVVSLARPASHSDSCAY